MAVGQAIAPDLARYVIGAVTGHRNGFRDPVARGATITSTGRRPTRPGRAVVGRHRKDLARSERLARLHPARWRVRRSGPVTTAPDGAFAPGQPPQTGERLVFDRPSPGGRIEDRAAPFTAVVRPSTAAGATPGPAARPSPRRRRGAA